MSTQVRWRRGTSAQHASFTGAEGEVTYDTTNTTLRAHNGSTAGGFILATQPWVTSQLVAGVADGSLTTAKLVNTVQNTIVGRVAAGSGAPSYLTSAEGRQALGMTAMGSGVAIATTAAEALAAQGLSVLARAMWAFAR